MICRDLLVQLDAEPGTARRDDVAVDPLDGRLQDLRVESAPGLDAFEQQEVVATGGELAICSGISGGVGSSNQSGEYGSNLRARRIAPEVVNCRWVPTRRSQRLPTASRICRRYAAERSRAARLGWRGSSVA